MADVQSSIENINNLRLPGQYFDFETRLHYNWNRYYSTDEKIYLTPDPLGFEGGINLYSYSSNNAINKYDPDGLTTACACDVDAWEICELRCRKRKKAAIQCVQVRFFLSPVDKVYCQCAYGEWLSPEKAARKHANDLLKRFKRAMSLDKSGRAGDPYNRAATELERISKNQSYLEEYREELRKAANDFRQIAYEVNHPMR